MCVCKLIKRNENHNRKRTDRSKNRQEGREIRVADTKTETEAEAESEAEDELVKLRRNDAEWNGIDYINCRWRADCLHENETQRRLGYELQKEKGRNEAKEGKARIKGGKKGKGRRRGAGLRRERRKKPREGGVYNKL